MREERAPTLVDVGGGVGWRVEHAVLAVRCHIVSLTIARKDKRIVLIYVRLGAGEIRDAWRLLVRTVPSTVVAIHTNAAGLPRVGELGILDTHLAQHAFHRVDSASRKRHQRYRIDWTTHVLP